MFTGFISRERVYVIIRPSFTPVRQVAQERLVTAGGGRHTLAVQVNRPDKLSSAITVSMLLIDDRM